MKCLHCGYGNLLESHHPSYKTCDMCNAYELTYVPQPHQVDFHRDKTKIKGIFGGFGSGKSVVTINEDILMSLEYPGTRGLVVAPTVEQLKKVFLDPLFNEWLPPFLVVQHRLQDKEIHLANGSVIYYAASDDETKLRGMNLGWAHMMEASGIKREIYDQLVTRIRHPIQAASPLGTRLLVESNPDMGWVRTVFVEEIINNPKLSCHILPTHLNKYLPSDFYEVASKNRPKWWVERFLHGSFNFAEGGVYPNFNETIVDDFEIPDHWERMIGYDPGWRDATAVGWYAIDPDEGVVYKYAEYHESGKTVPDVVKDIRPRIDSIPSGRIRFMKIDPSAKKTEQTSGKNVQSLLAEYGLYFSPANNRLEAGILKVNSYINRGKYKIFKSCINTIREGISYKFPEQKLGEEKNLSEKPIDYNNHQMDIDRYVLMELPDDPDMLLMDGADPYRIYLSENQKVEKIPFALQATKRDEGGWMDW
jgi:PBSX family phage terminase large subunit